MSVYRCVYKDTVHGVNLLAKKNSPLYTGAMLDIEVLSL